MRKEAFAMCCPKVVCGFPGCSNQYPGHYMLDVCGARHALAIVGQGWQAEVALHVKRLGLVTPDYAITPVVPDELLLPKIVFGEADVLLVLVTDAAMFRVVADLLEKYEARKVLVVVPSGGAIRIAESTKDGFERLSGFLRDPKRAEKNINA